MTNERATAWHRTLEALGDPTRRALFELLCEKPRSVGELADAVPVSRPAVSQHLKVLKDAGLVADRAAGTRRIYRVAAGGVEQLRSYVENLWDTALAGFASAVEEEAHTMSTEPTVIAPVTKTVVVGAPVETAFRIFTERLGEWWPLATHSIGEAVTATVEPRAGGRVYETHEDGAEADWGIVSVWEPPRRFAMEWKVNPDAAAPTVIDVRFADVEGGTRVDLEHRHWERLGPDAADTRKQYDEGWDVVLAGYTGLAG